MTDQVSGWDSSNARDLLAMFYPVCDEIERSIIEVNITGSNKLLQRLILLRISVLMEN